MRWKMLKTIATMCLMFSSVVVARTLTHAQKPTDDDIKFAQEHCGEDDPRGKDKENNNLWNDTRCSDVAFSKPELKIRQKMCSLARGRNSPGVNHICIMINEDFKGSNYKNVFPEYNDCFKKFKDGHAISPCKEACENYQYQIGCGTPEKVRYALKNCFKANDIDDTGAIDSICSDTAFTNPELKIKQKECSALKPGYGGRYHSLVRYYCNMHNIYSEGRLYEMFPEYAGCFNPNGNSSVSPCKEVCEKYQCQQGCRGERDGDDCCRGC